MSRTKSGVPGWVYYMLAVCISAATIPMYRYMFTHRFDGSQAASSVVVVRQFAVAQHPSLDQDAFFRKRLLPGELCEAGYVVLRSGSSYTQGMDASGHPSRCVDGYLILSQ